MMIKIFVFCLMLFPLTISAAWELCPTGAPYVQFGFADESYLYFITAGIPGVEKMKMYRTGNFGGDWEEVPLPVRANYVYWKCNDVNGAYSFYGSDSGVCWSSDGVNYRQTNEVTVENSDSMFSWGKFVPMPVAPVQLGRHWFIATEVGIVHSSNSGQTWSVLNLCRSDTVDAGAVFDCSGNMNGNYFSGVIKAVGSLLIAGIDKAIAVSPDTGKTWNKIPLPATGYVRAIAITSDGFYASDQTSGVYFSADTGKSWVFINDSLPRYTLTKFERIREMVTVNGNVYISVRPGVFTYEANRWVKVGAGYPDNVFTSRIIPFKNTLCCLTTDGAYYLENNTWKPIEFYFPSARIISTSVVRYNGELFAGSGAGVFRSADLGRTWKNVSSGINDQMFITNMYSCSLGLFVTGIVTGLYEWNAASEQWQRIGNDLVNINNSFTMAEHHSKLLIPQAPHSLGRTAFVYDPVNATVDSIKMGGSNSVLCFGDTIFSSSNGYLGSRICGLVSSNNSGSTWDTICEIPEILYLARSGNFLVATSVESIHFSPDLGKSWQTRKVPRGTSYGKTVASHNSDLFALRDSFVIVSHDQCNTWEQIRLPAWVKTNYISALHIENDIAFFASEYGLWRVPIAGLGSNVVSGVSIKTPECATPAATLHPRSFEVDLPDHAEICLQQIALDGRIVGIQRYGHFQPGRHRLPISAGKGTGVRLIRILADGKSVMFGRVLDVR